MRRTAAHLIIDGFAPLAVVPTRATQDRCQDRAVGLAGIWRWRWLTCFWLAWAAGVELPLMGQTSWDLARRPFRFSFTSSMFGDIRENDARAVVKGWGITLAQQLGLNVDPESRIYRSVEEVGRALLAGETDAVSMTVDEFWALPGRSNLVDRLMIGTIGETTTEEYLVLVRKDAPHQRFSDLKAKMLLAYDHPRMSVAEAWLDVALAGEGAGRLEDFRPTIVRERKLAKVVLPLFFRKADACLVNRKGFETMCEMNPQLRRDLRELGVSPHLLPMGFFFRRGYASAEADRMMSAFFRLPETPAGQQVLQVFQCSRVREEPMATLQSTLALLDQHRLLLEAEGIQPSIGAHP
ncbi:MAG: PhnD/SsuA/transferrin family substrate-binding protein [Verrucomicrobiales bacterium]|nr:PhnD/SsuA/transferrin family substrate-binding protein [Verrucomicrobiales bacterium]